MIIPFAQTDFYLCLDLSFFCGLYCCRVLCSCEGDEQQGKKAEMKILFFFSIVVHKKERNDGLFIHHSLVN